MQTGQWVYKITRISLNYVSNDFSILLFKVHTNKERAFLSICHYDSTFNQMSLTEDHNWHIGEQVKKHA